MARQDLLKPLLQRRGALNSLMAGYFNQDWGDDYQTIAAGDSGRAASIALGGAEGVTRLAD
jgi:hypothetical protein